jgi:hypothetical protein
MIFLSRAASTNELGVGQGEAFPVTTPLDSAIIATTRGSKEWGAEDFPNLPPQNPTRATDRTLQSPNPFVSSTGSLRMGNRSGMPFKLRKSSCVAVGTFNIYIFRPPWVGEVEGCPAGAEIKIHADLSKPGFQLSSPNLNCIWTVRPDRIALESAEHQKSCGEVMAEILRRLPETPLTAIGHNFEAAAEVEPDIGDRLGELFTPQSVAEGEIERQARVTTVRIGAQQYNLSLIRLNDRFAIAANVHTDLMGATNREARDAADRSLEFRSTAFQLSKELWAIEVEQ